MSSSESASYSIAARVPVARRLATVIATLLLLAVSGGVHIWSVGPAPAAASTAATDGIDCGCTKTGPYKNPAPIVAPEIETDGSSPKGTYRVSATGTWPAVDLRITKVSTNQVVFSISTSGTSWGFSPDEHRFVINGFSSPTETIQLYDLTAANPEIPVEEIAVATSSSRFGFSPHGRYFAYTWISNTNNAHVNHWIIDATSGDTAYQTSYTFDVGASNGKKFGEASFGFSPDDQDRTFVHAWVSGQSSVEIALANLSGPSTPVFSSTLTGTGFWQFSPCGDVLALLQQHNQVTVEVLLIGTLDGALVASESYSIGDTSFSTTADAHIVTVSGEDDVLAQNTSDDACPSGPDAAAPTWPTGSVLTATDVAERQVSLDWESANDDVGVTRYRVYQGPAIAKTLSASQTEFTLSNLLPGTSYTFRVEAGDAAGNWSTNGPTVSVATPGTALTCPAGSSTLGAGNVTNTSASLYYQGLASSSGYYLFQGSSHVGGGSGGGTSVAVMGLIPNTAYGYTVKTVDSSGSCTGSGSTSLVTTNFSTLDVNAIQGVIWNDSNGNGLHDGGESPINGQNFPPVGVYMYRIDSDGPQIASVTDGSVATALLSNGTYAFTNLEDGRYAVALITSPRVQTFPVDFQPQIVEIVDGRGVGNVNFGLRSGVSFPDAQTGTGDISGVVWDDLNANGVRDAGEPGLGGVEVWCYDVPRGSGCANEVAVTDAQGAWAYHNVTSGAVELYLGEGPNEDVGRYQTYPPDGQRYVAIVSSSEHVGGADFGFATGSAEISGQIWQDLDGDGIREAGEDGVDNAHGIEVCVEAQATGASVCTPVDAGSYTIGGLAAETYDVRAVLPEGWIQTTPHGGEPQTVMIDAPDATIPDIDFGVYDPGDVSSLPGAPDGATTLDSGCFETDTEYQNLTNDAGPVAYDGANVDGYAGGDGLKARARASNDFCTISVSYETGVTIGAGSTGLAEGDPVLLRITLGLDGRFVTTAGQNGYAEAEMAANYSITETGCSEIILFGIFGGDEGESGDECSTVVDFRADGYLQEYGGSQDQWYARSIWTLDSNLTEELEGFEDQWCEVSCVEPVVLPFDTGLRSVIFESHVGATLSVSSLLDLTVAGYTSGTAESDFADTFALSIIEPLPGFAGLSIVYDNSDPGPGNLPPVADAGGPYQVSEAGSTVVTAAGEDPEGGALEFAWDLDADGSFETPGESATFSAANLDGPATLQIAVQATDDMGLTTVAETTVEVLNVAPSATISEVPGGSVEGTPITLTGSATDPAPADSVSHAWEVTRDGVAVTSGSGASFAFTPDNDGQYVVTLTAKDDDGGAGTASVEIEVANVLPSVTLGSSTTLRRGEIFSSAGSFSDPGADTWTATVDYGDGSAVEPLALAADQTFNLAHTYTRAGVFTVTVCVLDDDGQSCGTLSVTVVAYAIFVGRDDCGPQSGGAFQWSGNRGAIIGDLHSNSGIALSGSRNHVDGETTYRCDLRVSGNENSFTAEPTKLGEVQSWPLQLTAADFICDIRVAGKLDLAQDGAWWVDGTPQSGQLAPMTVCADEIELEAANISGMVTLVASRIDISGSNLQLTPHQHDVLFFATGAGKNTLKVSGNDGQLSGALIAKDGQVSLSGSRNSVTHGALIGWTVSVSGSDWTIDATP